MATATVSDFKIYHEQLQAGMFEGVSQALNVFNAASANTILLSSLSHPGDYKKEGVFAMTANIIGDRDPTNTSLATAVKPTQIENIAVKAKRRVGPMEYTEDSIRSLGKTPQEASFIFGQQIGQAKAQDLVNIAIAAAEAALQNVAALNYSALTLSVKTVRTVTLTNAMNKMGDAGQRIACWVMHSKQYFDLVGAQIGENLTGMTDKIVYGASAATLGRPVVISDDPALINDVASTDTYQILGLVPGAVNIEESEQSRMVAETITGYNNLIQRIQGEYAATVGIRGFQWNIGSGGSAPTKAALGTHTNWTKVATSHKDCAGVRIAVQ